MQAVAVEVKKDLPVRQARFTRVLDAIAVEVVEHLAAEGIAEGRRGELDRFAAADEGAGRLEGNQQPVGAGIRGLGVGALDTDRGVGAVIGSRVAGDGAGVVESDGRGLGVVIDLEDRFEGYGCGVDDAEAKDLIPFDNELVGCALAVGVLEFAQNHGRAAALGEIGPEYGDRRLHGSGGQVGVHAGGVAAGEGDEAVAADEQLVIARVGDAVEVDRVATQVHRGKGVVGSLDDGEGAGIAAQFNVLEGHRIGDITESGRARPGGNHSVFQRFEEQPRRTIGGALAGTPSAVRRDVTHDNLLERCPVMTCATERTAFDCRAPYRERAALVSLCPRAEQALLLIRDKWLTGRLPLFLLGAEGLAKGGQGAPAELEAT